MPDGPAFAERSALGRRWRIPVVADLDAADLARDLAVPETLARCLLGRGIAAAAAAAFLAPTIRQALPDPSSIPGMDALAARLADAVIAGETVAVFADYDVDGATAGAILTRTLRCLGLVPLLYVPDRIAEGYGPSVAAFDRLAALGATVIVTVDCGTTALAPITAAQARGVDVLVVDHHDPAEVLPPARALANPRITAAGVATDCAAAGIAFLAAVALCRTLRQRGHFTDRAEPKLLDLLDLAALGTVCDVMPLTGLNRALVGQGLKVLATGGNPGLAALAQVAGLTEAPTARDLGFALGPRINAGGRIGRSDLGLHLLVTDDPAEAEALAIELDRLNRERREIEQAAAAEATAQAIRRCAESAAATVVADPTWHPGIVGIVAARLVERFARPAVVIALDGSVGRGSARSVAGVDLGAAIRAAKAAGWLIEGGGHAMAAGLTIAADAIDPFSAFLDDWLRRAGPAPVAELQLDGVATLAGALATPPDALLALGPYGTGNPEPRFAFRDVRVTRLETVGDGHLRCWLTDGSETGWPVAMAFRAAGNPLGAALDAARHRPVDLAMRLSLNRWQGRDRVQLLVDDAAIIPAP